MDAPEVPQIDVSELHARLGEGAVLIDVREPDEWLAARVPGVPLVPLGELPLRHDALPTGRTIHLICRTGARSQHAAEYLCTLGYDAVNVAGGTVSWIEAGYDVESGPAAG
jgi:rhodanese-related sulfurtransferase